MKENKSTNTILVLYSDGLDSRLTVKLLQKLGFNIKAVYFKLPFLSIKEGDKLKKMVKFSKKEKFSIIIIDVCKDPLYTEYLSFIKSPEFSRGKGLNPCKDCKIFMFKKAKHIADTNNINIIANGDVLDQRPQSQTKKAIRLIDKEIGFDILRPLTAKNLYPTQYEIKGLIDRNKLYDFKKRERKEQIEMAKEFDIDYPTPGGGCLLCEKEIAERIEFLLKKDFLNENTNILAKLGRHLFIDNNWYVVGRNYDENCIIEKYKNAIISGPKKPAVFFASDKKKAENIQKSFSTKDYDHLKKFYI